MSEYTTPGVYIDEGSRLPPSVASVETAIPAFIGYTQKAVLKKADDLVRKPRRISSLIEYERYFGKADPEKGIVVDFVKAGTAAVSATARIDASKASIHLLYYAMQLFFANGGGPCYVISVNTYARSAGKIIPADLEKGIEVAATVDEVTLLVIPEAVNIAGATAVNDYYRVFDKALNQCAELKDRFTVMDICPRGTVADLRKKLTGDVTKLKYGAAYYPRLFSTINYDYSNEVKVVINGVAGSKDLAGLNASNKPYYQLAKAAIEAVELLLPASPAIAGIYTQTDNNRGVWKAPANVNIGLVSRPEVLVTEGEQEGLNVDTVSGKSINVIRSFTGRGPAIIWGARTLAGNDNEWRYVPVRRFFNMIEESTKNATEQFVFEPNDPNTWIRVRAMLENYLTQQWRAGALMGMTTKEAFYVRVGLGQTMTANDISEGRMIVEIGMAVVRPAEFIILRFMHKMVGVS